MQCRNGYINVTMDIYNTEIDIHNVTMDTYYIVHRNVKTDIMATRR